MLKNRWKTWLRVFLAVALAGGSGAGWLESAFAETVKTAGEASRTEIRVPEKEKKPESDGITKKSEKPFEKTPEKKNREKIPFPHFTLEPKLGFIYLSRARMDDRVLGDRFGLEVLFGLSLGGNQYSFEFDPIFVYEDGGSARLGDVVGGGAYMGMVYRLGNWTGDRFIPGFGLGIRGVYLWSSEIDYGLELYGRAVVELNWYLVKGLGIYAELGLLYGATGLKSDAYPDLTMGSGFGVDILAGLRFP